MQVGAYAVDEPVRRAEPGRREGASRPRSRRRPTTSAAHEDEFRTFLSESAKMPPALAKKIVLPKWTGEVDADSVAEHGRS